MPSKSKAKAVRTFLSGISNQIPDHALSLLVKDAKAIRVLLHKSIEALPMGSPIRKSVDGDLENCVKIMKLEVENRMKEFEERNETEEVEEAETTFSLPNFNDELIQYNLIRATERKDKDMLKELHCLDSTTLEMLVTKKDTIDYILNKFSSQIVCGRLSATDLNSFIRLVAKAFVTMNDPKSVIRCIKMFLKLFQISTGLVDVEDVDHAVAIDLGKVIGSLVCIALSQSEIYKSVLDEACTTDDSDDESSDEDESSRPVKRRKISLEERKRIYADCKNDVLRVISLVFSNFSNSKEERKIAACVAFGYVDSILLGSDSLALCCLKREKLNKEAAQKDGSKLLVDALEICNVAPRKDLPSAYLLSKGAKMCSLLQRWAKNAAGSIEHVGVSNISSKNEESESESENDSDEPSDDNDTNAEEAVEMEKEVEDDDDDDDDDDEEMVGTVNANDEKQDDVQNEKDDSSVEEAVDNSEDSTNDNVSNEENTTTTTKNSRAGKKKVISALPPVPEDEEADVEVEINVDVADNKEKGQSPQKQSSRATRSRKRTDSASSQETPTRTRKSRTSTGTGSILETLGTEDVPDTPSRRTRSRTESNASETSISTPLRRSTRARGESNASETSVSTPLRRSTRARGDSSASDLSINTPRRSARKRK
ncbi:predicted protein [Chaetoceros tenuissimus]|uniref:Uncharacterized protein n=1 Tax=Chaetoceros tenuissimus TaxID=426638 RepID=A0AAD3D970_9STRA|nr:predicted protein [Chaetoceros tenuissimus]